MTYDLNAAYRATAVRVLDSLAALPVDTRERLVERLAVARSTVSQVIAEAITSDDPVTALALSLRGEILVGDAQRDADRLRADVQPWASIRRALEDLIASWRTAHPGWRTAFDRRHAPFNIRHDARPTPDTGEKASSST